MLERNERNVVRNLPGKPASYAFMARLVSKRMTMMTAGKKWRPSAFTPCMKARMLCSGAPHAVLSWANKDVTKTTCGTP